MYFALIEEVLDISGCAKKKKSVCKLGGFHFSASNKTEANINKLSTDKGH